MNERIPTWVKIALTPFLVLLAPLVLLIAAITLILVGAYLVLEDLIDRASTGSRKKQPRE